MQKVCMLHIGKTGGSALKAKFVATAEELNANGIEVTGLKHAVTLQDMIREGQENVLFFVRHPVSRFVSAFNSRLRQGLPRYDSPWNRAEKRAFGRFRQPNDLAQALSADGDASFAAKWDMQSINHVKHHLTRWLVSPEYLEANRASFFYIGTTETMDEDVPRLFAKLGVSAPSDDLDRIDRHATPAEYSRDLSEQAVANLTEWYAKDIEIYEWCLANRAAINRA